MEGFFVTVDCSKMLNYSNDVCYKIFIDKSEMTIVYELKEWIRFMFSLDSCFFLVHDNSVIHELEDIQVLEILKVLELRPCVRPNCLHKTMEKNLLNKLNLFTYWKEVKVHKLFLARQSRIIQKIPRNQLNNSNSNENMSYENINEQSNKSGAANSHQSVISSLISTHYNENKNEVTNEKLSNNNEVDLKINTSTGAKRSSSDEIRSPHFFQNSDLDNLNLCTENITLSSPTNKKPKLKSELKKQTTGWKNKKRVSIPFSLGALLSNIREEAQNQDLKEKEVLHNTDDSGGLVCSDDENEDKNFLPEKGSDLSASSGKRKRRRRKHKKQNLKLDLFPSNTSKSFDVSCNFKEASFCAKRNHIRFSDNDEIVETETADSKSTHFNSFKNLNNEFQEIPSAQLTPEATPLVEENGKDCSSIIKHNHEVCEESVNQNSVGLNYTSLSDSCIEKKEFNESHHNLSALESLKQKITNPGIFSRFY